MDTPARWRAMFGTRKQQTVAFWIALAFLVGSLLYPPWYHYSRSGGNVEHPNGWFFIFDTAQGERYSWIAKQIDYGRLVFQDIIIVATLASLAWVAAKLSLRPSRTALFMLTPPVLILMFVVGKPIYLDWDVHVELQREAVKCYRKAAEQGKASAQNNLGLCYYKGQGVAQDYEEAVKWYCKAAEQGDAAAQCNLGICCEFGRGVPKDFVQAYKWYNLAANAGGKVWGEMRILEASMRPEQISEALRLSREWQPKNEAANH